MMKINNIHVKYFSTILFQNINYFLNKTNHTPSIINIKIYLYVFIKDLNF